MHLLTAVLGSHLLRLVLWVVLCEAEESMNLMGPDCSSWGVPARGTTRRTYVNVNGAMHLDFVGQGNLCISRTFGPV